MAIKLHTCPMTFLKGDHHACARVWKALDEKGIEYELVKNPGLPKGRRKELERISGQRTLPVIEFEDGSTYREESKDMAATIREGRLFAKARAAAPQA